MSVYLLVDHSLVLHFVNESYKSMRLQSESIENRPQKFGIIEGALIESGVKVVRKELAVCEEGVEAFNHKVLILELILEEVEEAFSQLCDVFSNRLAIVWCRRWRREHLIDWELVHYVWFSIQDLINSTSLV